MRKFLTITIIKKATLFIALWISSYFVVDAVSSSWDDFTILLQSCAIAIVIAFVWKRVSKKYL